jgi:hypothetical protein
VGDPFEMPPTRYLHRAYGRVPVMKEVERGAKRRKVALLLRATIQVLEI